MRRTAPALVLAALCSVPGRAATVPLGPVVLSGPVKHAGDLSGVARRGDLLLVVSDEDDRIQLLDPLPGGREYRAREAPIRLGDDGAEIDLEGIAVDGDTVYAVGSHSRLRRRLDADDPWRKNRTRISEIVQRPARDRLVRLRLDAGGGVVGAVESVDLRPLLERDALLAPFSRIPGKENGVDIEGLAVRDGRLFVGLRSPVLRSDLVPVLVLDFDAPASYETRFVALGGMGIRGLETVAGGFLLLAATEREVDGAAIFFWDGDDELPGSDRRVAQARRVGELPPAAATPEGIVVVRETEESWEAILVYDGSPAASLVRIDRPASGARTSRPAPRPG